MYVLLCSLCVLAYREEKIRKLEQQLRTAYGSLGRAALRASGGQQEVVAGSSLLRISRLGLAASEAPVGQSLDETIQVCGCVCVCGTIQLGQQCQRLQTSLLVRHYRLTPLC